MEAKNLDDRDLDGNREHREQFELYKNLLNNIVFTYYLDFYFHIGGEFRDAVRLAEICGNKIVVNEEPFLLMVSKLFNSQPQKIISPVKLAKVMASHPLNNRFIYYLKIDFPRISYSENAEEYHRLATIGEQLRKPHLMEDVPLTKHAQFNNPVSNMVDKPEYKGSSVWINKARCFEDVRKRLGIST